MIFGGEETLKLDRGGTRGAGRRWYCEKFRDFAYKKKKNKKEKVLGVLLDTDKWLVIVISDVVALNHFGVPR